MSGKLKSYILIMKFKTHCNFKSVDNLEIKNAYEIYTYLKRIRFYDFETKTTPWEKQRWDSKALQQFKLNFSKIDRLYYLNRSERYDVYTCRRGLFPFKTEYRMISRMEYEKEPLYVELWAVCSEYCEYGFIFISRNVNSFMTCVLDKKIRKKENLDKDLVYELLQKDSIYVDREEEEKKIENNSNNKKKIPTLNYFCHKAIYYNDALRYGYKFHLPKIVIKSIDNFIVKRFYENLVYTMETEMHIHFLKFDMGIIKNIKV